MNKTKLFAMISIFCILIIVPTSFAADGEATAAIENTAENLTSTGDAGLLTADYYFNASAENDTGNGSAETPYKYFKASRIVSNSNLYLANGEYTLDRSVSINNVTIIGQDASQTILRYSGTGFTVSSSLTLKNLTLVNLRITDNGNLTAVNTLFNDSKYSGYGGVIESQKGNTNIVLDNCTFYNISADYGGAIYLKNGTLTVSDSLFSDTHSKFYGGAIAMENKAKARIDDTKFLNSYSSEDVGGAIYLINSDLAAYNMEINNCSSIIGGAIVSLKSNLVLNNFTGKNNKAKYDGGTIYSMYRKFHISNSLLENNSAENAGAIFVYNVDDFLINYTTFRDNHASNRAGAFYSAYLQEPYYDTINDTQLHNQFIGNSASTYNDLQENYLPELFVGSGDYQLYNVNSSEIGDLPSYYDLRKLGMVTSVKNQGSNGNCWAFAVLGALESNILMAGGNASDLSEQNMKNLMALYSSYGWGYETNQGGTDEMGYSYILSWLGPVNEADDNYKINTVISPILDSIAHVQNILFFDRKNYTDNDAIKQAVMTYGGVVAPMSINTKYLKNGKYYYCYNKNESIDHLVVIVGWNDTLQIQNASGKGAWIVKNSWGSSWGENGYFYVSYYDTKFALGSSFMTYVMILNDTIKFDKNYQYDFGGVTDYFLNSSNVVWYKNRYVAGDDEYLAAVSTYFQKDTSWELSVYVNDNLKLTQSGTAVHSYKTIDLNRFIHLNKGDVFEVVFKITVDSEAAFPISEALRFNTKFYMENNSFLSYDGINWVDLYNLTWAYPGHTYDSQVACIKAFTVLNAIGTSIELEVVDSSNLAQFRAIVKNQYGYLVKSGDATFTIEGNDITVEVVDGIADLTYLFNDLGTKTVSVGFSAVGFIASSISSQVDIGRYHAVLTVPDVTAGYGSGKKIVATLKDYYGSPIANVNVRIIADSLDRTLKTNSQGQVSLDISYLTPGNYVAEVIFSGTDLYSGVNATSNIAVNKMDVSLTAGDVNATYTVPANMVATLKDAKGNAIEGAKLKIVVSSLVKYITTDANGQVFLNVANLNPGTYTATVTFIATEFYNKATATAKVYVTKMGTVLTAENVTAIHNVGGNLVATLTDDGNHAISGAKIKIVIPNRVTKYITTDANGQVFLNVSSYDIGVYTATITFVATDLYNKATATAKITVTDKINTTLAAADVTVIRNVGGYLVATLTDDGNHAISGAKIKIVLNKVSKYITTDANGQVSLKISNMDIGTYTATITFVATELYNKATTTAKVYVVEKMDTYITAPDVIAVYHVGGKLVATLKDANGNVMSGAKLKIVIPNKITKYITTDANGQVSLDVSGLDIGSYTATITFVATDLYNKATTTAKITVINKIDTVITADDVNATYKDGSKLIATLKDVGGNVITGAKVKIVLNNVVKYISTDVNGQVALSLANLNPGNYTAAITFVATDLYNKSSTTAKVTIS